jgi:thymidylate synthase (FAD)
MAKLTIGLVAHTPDPERLVAAAARSCWSNRPFEDIYKGLSEGEIDRLLKKVILRGHHSVLEHVNFTFALSGISRVLTHQLVRHRIASYSQLSQQHADHADIDYIIPPAVDRDPTLAEEFIVWTQAAQNLYSRLIEKGVPRGSARYVLPSACETRMVFTMNARSLFNLISQRDCGAEEWEFRSVAHRMHQELVKIAPRIFRFTGPNCRTEGACLEGDIGVLCGMAENGGAPVYFRESDLQAV